MLYSRMVYTLMYIHMPVLQYFLAWLSIMSKIRYTDQLKNRMCVN